MPVWNSRITVSSAIGETAALVSRDGSVIGCACAIQLCRVLCRPLRRGRRKSLTAQGGLALFGEYLHGFGVGGPDRP